MSQKKNVKHFLNLNFAKNVFENIIHVYFDVEKYIIIINEKKSMFKFHIENGYIYNQVKHNGLYNILYIQVDFKHNIICKHIIRENKTSFSCR